MFKSLAVTVVALVTFAPAWAQEAPTASSAAAPQLTAEEVATRFRNELQAARADIVSKELTLIAEQAAGFWPLFREYQAEQNVIIDAQIKVTQTYADRYAKHTEADSLAYVGALLECDGKAQALRKLSLIGQAKVASGIPFSALTAGYGSERRSLQRVVRRPMRMPHTVQS